MSIDSANEWLSVPEVAEILDVRLRDVRDMMRSHELLATRRQDTNTVVIHRDELVQREGVWQPLASLRGTVTVLEDAGLSDDAAMEWLLATNTILAGRPIDVLREGNVHAVRRAALVEAV